MFALIQEEPQVAMSFCQVAIGITVIGISAAFIAWVCYILATDDDSLVESPDETPVAGSDFWGI